MHQGINDMERVIWTGLDSATEVSAVKVFATDYKKRRTFQDRKNAFSVKTLASCNYLCTSITIFDF